MDKNELLRYASFADYEQAFDSEIRKEGESFIRIGYLLRIGQDTDIIKQSGYRNVEEFAKAKYEIDKSQASRYMRINEMFSEGGYSDRLQERYQGFGVAKLAIMLQLPPALNEELSKDYTKAEINALKEEIDEEKKVSDLEVLMEDAAEEPAKPDNNLERALLQLLRDDTGLYKELWEENAWAEDANLKNISLILSPSGESIRSIRIPGVGRKMLSVKGTDAQINLIDARSGERENFSWQQLISGLSKCFCREKDSAGESWEIVYGEAFPEAAEEPKKPEVAPVQRQTEAKAKKVSKVQKAKVKEPEKEQAPEPQVEGQRDIYDYKEAIPEGMEIPEKPTDTECREVTDEAFAKEDAVSEAGQETAEMPEPTVTDAEENLTVTGEPAAGMADMAREEKEPSMEKTPVPMETCAEIAQDVVEDVDKIWDRLELNAATINIYIRNNKGSLEYIEESNLQKMYRKAIDVAADMERLLNVKKYHTA